MSTVYLIFVKLYHPFRCWKAWTNLRRAFKFGTTRVPCALLRCREGIDVNLAATPRVSWQILHREVQEGIDHRVQLCHDPNVRASADARRGLL